MNDLKLVRPNWGDEEALLKYKQMMLESGSSMDGCGSLRNTEDMYFWIKESMEHEKGINIPEHFVRATQWLAKTQDDEIVGMIQVRHQLTDYLFNYGGHIGYSVRPDMRQKGIASWMLAHVLPYCKSLGISKVLITCLEENEASRRTILKNGGIYEDTRTDGDERLQRYWITLQRKSTI